VFRACYNNVAGEIYLFRCFTFTLRARECPSLRRCLTRCFHLPTYADIGDNACTGVTACDPIHSKIRIVNRSCNGKLACAENEGDVINSW